MQNNNADSLHIFDAIGAATNDEMCGTDNVQCFSAHIYLYVF